VSVCPCVMCDGRQSVLMCVMCDGGQFVLSAGYFGTVHVVGDARAGQCVMPGVALATINHVPVHVSVSEARV
jgi:hypothetical protein